MQSRVYIETWGCQMNLHQSEGIGGVLLDAGFSIVNTIADADVVIFNGCMVRQKAEEKVFGRVGAVVEEKRLRPVILGVGGCLGQIHGAELLKRFASIDFVFGSSGHQVLPDLIERSRTKRLAEIAEPVFETDIKMHRSNGVSGMVTITEGCSNFCAYCIVPFARGPMRSRPRDLILEEVGRLVDEGYREVLLLGQNVNSYGTDQLRNGYGDFSSLLCEVAQTGIDRIRFTTSHPKDMPEAVFRVMADELSVCPHLHLACQSGSDRILTVMNRKYDRAHYEAIVKLGRNLVPDLNISTDLIVGFPGESDDDFEQTMELIESVRFGSVFAAMYSPRPRTRSAELADDVPPDVKKARLERVLARQREIALQSNQAFIGHNTDVLIEGASKTGLPYGRARDHRTVMCRGEAAVGETVTVSIDAVSASSLTGGILTKNQHGGTR